MKRQSILILTDTQSANFFGTYSGNPALSTPKVDALAADGVRFDKAYTCAPVCGPARSALFTGLYPHAAGVFGNDQAPHSDLPTIGQRLQQAGIRTGYTGKWHLDGSDYFGDGRCPEGWDPEIWFDGRNYLDSLPDDAARDLSRKVLNADAVKAHGITSEFTMGHRAVERALRFIEKYRDEDFFLVVSIDEPHHPFICPEPFVSAFEDFRLPIGPSADDDLTTKPRGQREWATHYGPALDDLRVGAAIRFPEFFACNSYADELAGRVFDAAAAHTPDALTIFTSDHGDAMGAHRLLSKGPAMYEEVTRIPLVVRWPNQAPPGTVSASPVSHIDLPATVLDYFGLPRPDLLQGHSLLSVLKQPGQTHDDGLAYIEFNRFEIDHDGYGAFAPIRCVTDGRYKLAVNLLEDTDEFYDLESDPHELHNAIDDPSTASIRNGLHDALLDWMNNTRDPLRGPQWKRRAWRELPASSWGGPTRPRPFDEPWFPRTLLYDTAREIDRLEYDKF
jgi:uncharacterized sulfatase